MEHFADFHSKYVSPFFSWNAKEETVFFIGQILEIIGHYLGCHKLLFISNSSPYYFARLMINCENSKLCILY